MEQGQNSPDHIQALTDHLRSHAPWIRRQAVEELLHTGFERFERPPHLSLLLAAMNAPELRDSARDSLTRVLRGMELEELEQIRLEDRRALRAATKVSRPQQHADFLVEVSNVLLRIRDTEAIGVLEELVERSTIRQYVRTTDWRSRSTARKIVRSFEGTPEEEHEVRSVRSAAHVACERLKLIAEKGAAVADLLHPADRPEDEELLRPAESAATGSEHLLRPAAERIEP